MIDALGGELRALEPDITALADAIWDDPELRWNEHRSVRRQIDVATAHGMSVVREVGGIPTAFTAEIGRGGPVIAVLGEFDALADLSQASGAATPRANPDTVNSSGHGCGHNLLGAGSLAAAIAAGRVLVERGVPGRIRYYGCPAEEAAAGKTFLVKAGTFDDVAAAVSWHPMHTLSASQVRSLAYTQVHFHFTGRAAHAGSAPAHGRSALDALELMNVGVNFLREHMPDTARIHYAITDAGGASPNVVQAHASAYYIVRADTVTQMRALYDRVVDVARGAALMTGTTVEIDLEGACAELLPNTVLETAMQQHLTDIGPVAFDDDDHRRAAEIAATLDAEQVRAARSAAQTQAPLATEVLPLTPPHQRIQLTGSTDVGDVSWTVPTVQLMGATAALGTPLHSWQMVAQGKLPAAHKGMMHAALVMAASALELATDPILRAAAAAEHAESLARAPYVCPIPDEVLPPPVRERTRRTAG